MNDNLDACGSVAGGNGSSFRTVFVAAGAQQNGLAAGPVADYDTDVGNPAVTCTTGGFLTQQGAAVFTLAWVQVGGLDIGSNATFSRQCTYVLYQQMCTPESPG